MRAQDTPNGYGIVSIALHWLTAIVVIVIWFIGSSIRAGEDPESTLRLHTSIALIAYLLLWARIVWRFVKGHPGPMPMQAGVFYALGKYTHYIMLVAIAAMLVSGPVIVWSLEDSLRVFDWFALPSPLALNMPLHDAMYGVHKWGSRIIIVGTILHLGGVYKHAAFNQDGTFGKMLVPARGERGERG
jgi:cytochrome b561